MTLIKQDPRAVGSGMPRNSSRGGMDCDAPVYALSLGEGRGYANLPFRTPTHEFVRECARLAESDKVFHRKLYFRSEQKNLE